MKNCEEVCVHQGARVSQLRQSEKELRGEVRSLTAQLATVTAERDELASDIVRLKRHCAAVEEAAKANREACKKAEEDRDEWLMTVQEMVKLITEGSAAISQTSAHPAVAQLCMRLRAAERSEARAKVMREALERIADPDCTEIGFNLRRIARTVLQEATND